MKSRPWIYLGVLSLLFSCANSEANKDREAFMEIPVEKPVELSTSEAYSLVIENKIKEQLEGYKLKESHPAFTFSNEKKSPLLKNISASTELEKIELLGQEVKGDTIVIQFTTHLTEESGIVQDTLTAIMVTKEIELEGETLKTTTISFRQ